LLGLMTTGRMLNADDNLGSAGVYEKDDHFGGHHLGNETVRKCSVKDWWVSCKDEADDGSDDGDN